MPKYKVLATYATTREAVFCAKNKKEARVMVHDLAMEECALLGFHPNSYQIETIDEIKE